MKLNKRRAIEKSVYQKQEADYARAKKLYDKTIPDYRRKEEQIEFERLPSWETALWMDAVREIRKAKRSSNIKLQYISDKIRRDRLMKPDYRISPDINIKPCPEWFNEHNEFTVVIETPLRRIFMERWTASCKMAFKRKYGTTSVSTIKKVMPQRLKVIGDSIGYRLASFNWDKGIAIAIFIEKPPQYKRVQLYNPVAKSWTLVDVARGRVVSHKARHPYKNVPIMVSARR